MAARAKTPAGKMQGKKFMVSATWNAPREAFDNSNGVLFGGKGTSDLHNTSKYKFTGYDILPDFWVFDIFKNPDIPRRLKTTSGIWRNIAC
jgi:NADPH dehydrogenase (quinone)